MEPRPLAWLARRPRECLLLALGKFAEAGGQSREELLCLLRLRAQASHVLNLPQFVEVLHDGGVVDASVDGEVLGDACKVVVQVRVLPVCHFLRRHDNLSFHHVRVRDDRAVRVDTQHLGDEALVRFLVPRLIACNLRTDARAPLVSRLTEQLAHIAMRDLGRALLERGVDEAPVRIAACVRIEPGGDEPHDGLFNGAHIHAATEVEVAVEQVTVAVLLRCPLTRPPSESSVHRARGVVDALESVEQSQVRRQGLLCDHIADQDKE
mmetsp:Transcript_31614/g.66221  ORF Transcript_31614/g.66221 Transcript_31614/m.66221 type:complete len:266 (+) Transcript_31614:442-1239(+)